MSAMRTGVTPFGDIWNPTYMPWPYFANFTDDELWAICEHLSVVR